MTNQQSTVERAFDLARNGGCRNILELRAALRSEKCDGIEAHLAGKSMVRQLQALMKAKETKPSRVDTGCNERLPRAQQDER